jgi:hypothetical protein
MKDERRRVCFSRGSRRQGRRDFRREK